LFLGKVIQAELEVRATVVKNFYAPPYVFTIFSAIDSLSRRLRPDLV